MMTRQRALRILLVEDHPDVVEMMRLILTQLGHCVVIAGDVADATRAAQSERFDLLLCDFSLPDGDACDVLRLVKPLGVLKAIALTAHGEPILTRCRESGFDLAIRKPIEIDDIPQILDRVAGAAP